VLQSWRDHAKWRVRELLHHLGAYYARYSTQEMRRPWDTGELLDLVGLTGQAATRIGNLSGAAPSVLRRMARRESGSRVAARRERAMLRAT
jgi:hypothetical protein